MRREPSECREESVALARDCRERADAEALLVDVLLPDDGLAASDAFRAYVLARVGAWRTAARAAQVAGELTATGGLVGALEAVLRLLATRRRRGPEPVHAVYDTVIARVTELHARAEAERRERVMREIREGEEHRRGEEWKGDAPWRGDDGPT
jgi:hypothetical protein